MYPSSSSSSSSTSSHNSMGPTGGGGGSNLIRYGSAPGSLITAAVDSVIGQQRSKEFLALGGHPPPRYFSSEASAKTTDESTSKTAAAAADQKENNSTINGLQSSYGSSLSSSSPLVRHSSSPAGFLNRLASAASTDNGFSVTRGVGSYNLKGGSDSVCGIQRLNSQLSFTRQDSLSQITEESEDGEDDIHDEGHRKAAHSYATASFGMGSWDNSSTIMFSGPPGKRAKNDIVGGLNMMETQFQFGLSQTALEMTSMEHMMDIPQDSVPCKARAKRGCATHPRSIAERERRTRISEKLKKLQDLVPNMDKQTSYSDMLDLAVQHIKGLQTQVQKLNTELEHCTCGCKQTTHCSQ